MDSPQSACSRLYCAPPYSLMELSGNKSKEGSQKCGVSGRSNASCSNIESGERKRDLPVRASSIANASHSGKKRILIPRREGNWHFILKARGGRGEI